MRALLSIPTVLLVLFIGVRPAKALPVLVDYWGTCGREPGQLVGVMDVSAAHGQVIVLTDGGSTVDIFSLDGSFVSHCGGSLEFGQGRSIVEVADGSIVLTRDFLNTVLHRTRDGVLLDEFVYGPGNLAYLAAGLDGNLFVSIPEQFRIKKYTPSGALLTSWGRYGTGDGEFGSDGTDKGPKAVTVDPRNGNVIVTDPLNRRVQTFSPDGQFLSAAPLDHRRIADIAAAPDGTRYVIGIDSGDGGSCVHAYTADWLPLGSWGSLGSAPGQFNQAMGIYVASDGRVYVADGGNCRIQVFAEVPVPAIERSWGRLKAQYR